MNYDYTFTQTTPIVSLITRILIQSRSVGLIST